jgi:Uma2 family endonuclease
MSAVLKLTAQAYLEQERLSDTKHEFCNDEMFAMSGASFAHHSIVGNLIRELGNQLRKRPCRVLPSDVQHYVRQAENRWLLSEYRDAEELILPSIECRLNLADVYENE